MMRTIEIIVASDGQTRVETKGFAGGECLEASRFLETALGKITSESRTAEFYEVAAHQQTHLQEET